MKRPIRHVLIWALLAALLVSFPGVQADAQIEPTIRVWLRRLKTEDALRIGV